MSTLRLLSALVCAGAIAAVAATAHPAHATMPGADGRIAFITFTYGNTGNVFTIEPDGGGLRQVTFLTSADGQADSPQWSPDGKQIVFSVYGGPNGPRLWVVNADGSNLHPAFDETDTYDDDQGNWSPDGSRIIFRRCAHNREFCAIYTVKTDGHGLNAQTHNIGGPGEAFDVKPEFSPDGQTISFSSFNRGGVQNGIYLIGNGSKVSLLTPTALEAVDGDWAPDGSKLVFWGPCCVAQVTTLYTIKPDGSGLHQLTDGSQGQDLRPSFSPQGDRIAFQRASFDFSTSDLWVMNADGSGAHLLVPDAGSPGWGTAP
jgi:TolB protein